MKGPEPILAQLRDRLKDHLPAKLVALAFLDPAVPDPYAYEIGDQNHYERLPALEVMWLPSAVQDDVLDRINVAYGVGVRIYASANTPGEIELITMRLARAALEVLWDGRAADAFSGFELRFAGGLWQPSDLRRNEQEMLERDVLLPVQCWAAEERAA